jgi:glycosyltransferase involved in cell wall biosynthesis
MPEVIRNGEAGFVDNDVSVLVGHMRRLLADRDEAAELSRNARAVARRRFSIERFVRDWDAALTEVADVRPRVTAAAAD